MIKKILDLFNEHPNSVGETYPQHFLFALEVGVSLLVLGIICIVHSIFPFWFVKTTSHHVEKIHERMKDRNNRS